MNAIRIAPQKCVAILVLLSLLVLMPCCSETSRFSNFESLPPEGWAYGDTVTVTFPKTDSISHGTLCVALRHNNDYRYSNLWIEVTVPLAVGGQICDTVNIVMADPYGKWRGSGFGATYQLVDTLYNDIAVDLRRPFGVRHIMRVDTLTNIDLIGLTFNPFD